MIAIKRQVRHRSIFKHRNFVLSLSFESTLSSNSVLKFSIFFATYETPSVLKSKEFGSQTIISDAELPIHIFVV